MDDNKFSITYEDYLPNGTSWEALDKALVNKPVEFTRENLAKIIDPKFLDLSEEEFEDFVKKQYSETKEVPDWVINALTKAGCDMSFISKGKYDKSFID